MVYNDKCKKSLTVGEWVNLLAKGKHYLNVLSFSVVKEPVSCYVPAPIRKLFNTLERETLLYNSKAQQVHTVAEWIEMIAQHKFYSSVIFFYLIK